MVHIPLSPPFTSSLPPPLLLPLSTFLRPPLSTLPLPSPSLHPPPPPLPPSPLTESRSVYDTLENALRQKKDLKQVQQQEQAPPPLSQPAALSRDKPQSRILPSHSAVGPMGSGTAVRGVAGHGFLWKPSIVDTVVNCLSSLPPTFLPSLLPFLSTLPPFPPSSLPLSLPLQVFTPKQLKLIKQQQKLLDELQKKTEREAERRRKLEVRRKKREDEQRKREGRKKGKKPKGSKVRTIHVHCLQHTFALLLILSLTPYSLPLSPLCLPFPSLPPSLPPSLTHSLRPTSLSLVSSLSFPPSLPPSLPFVSFCQEPEPQRYFGSPLEKVVEDDGVPLFIKQCAKIIEASGLKTEGIYRVSGKKDDCLALQDQYDQG